MNRRDLFAVLGGVAIGWPFAARAQQKAMPVIGWVGGTSLAAYGPALSAFRQALSEIGF